MFKFLYFLFFAMFPFYLFSSGQPQISHLILVVIYGLTLLKSSLDFSRRQILFFNNPNQLEYYAVASLNIYFILGFNEVRRRDDIEIIKNITVSKIIFLLFFINFDFYNIQSSIFNVSNSTLRINTQWN